MTAGLKALLLILEFSKYLFTHYQREQFRDRIAEIKADPVAEWNKRLAGGVHQPSNPPTGMSPAATGHAEGNGRGGSSEPAVHGQSAVVFRAGGAMRVARVGPNKRDQELEVPTFGSEGSAGIDLRSRIDTKLWPGQQMLVPTGFAYEIPQGWCGQIWPRSGKALKQRLDRRAGLIDSDYRGELSVLLINESDRAWNIAWGERIGQMVIVPYYRAEIEVVETLNDTERADGGFGSTGDA